MIGKQRPLAAQAQLEQEKELFRAMFQDKSGKRAKELQVGGL